MPLGFPTRKPSGGPVPEGHPIIAQRFNVGISAGTSVSPDGTADRFARRRGSGTEFSRPFGTYPHFAVDPNIEMLGYSHSSLRDERSIDG